MSKKIIEKTIEKFKAGDHPKQFPGRFPSRAALKAIAESQSNEIRALQSELKTCRELNELIRASETRLKKELNQLNDYNLALKTEVQTLESDKHRLAARLDACEYAMVLMQGVIRARRFNEVNRRWETVDNNPKEDVKLAV